VEFLLLGVRLVRRQHVLALATVADLQKLKKFQLLLCGQ